MSVCASANPFSSRSVGGTTGGGGRRPQAPVANDERWVALNKNIFQDILNAILIQTTFSSASAGKRHQSPRPSAEASVQQSPSCSIAYSSSSSSSAAPSPLSFSALDASSLSAPPNHIVSAFKDTKDIIGRAFDSTNALDPLLCAKNEEPDEKGFPCEALILQDDGRSAKERETFSSHGNGRHPSQLEVNEQLLRVPANAGGQSGSFGVNREIVCSSRLRDQMSSAFSKVGAYDHESGLLSDSRLSVYCEETYLGKVPMMIIGLRPYHHHLPPDKTKLSCLLEQTNQISLHHSNAAALLKVSPMEKKISANSDLDPLNSSLLADGGRCDQYDRRVAKTTGGRFLPPQPTDQLHINPSAGGLGGVGVGGVARNGQKQFLRSMCYPEHHHSESADEQNAKRRSSLKLSPADVQASPTTTPRLMTNDASSGAGGTGLAKDLGRKSSRDHSILTILGLLSSTQDEDDRCQQSSMGVKTKHGVGGEGSEAGGTGGLEKNRLLGIGVTVIGRSRWMAVDKCIVYDMIDQVLNGEHDYFTNTDDDDSFYSPTAATTRGTPSKPPSQGVLTVSPQIDRSRYEVLSDGQVRKRGHHLPRTQRCVPTFQAPCMNASSHDVKRKGEFSGIEGDLKQNHDKDLLPSSSSSFSSSSSSSFASPSLTTSSSQERPINSKPSVAASVHCESPAVRERLSMSWKSLEGVSVLRSLLSDDPIEVCHGGLSATTEALQTPRGPISHHGGLSATTEALQTPRGPISHHGGLSATTEALQTPRGPISHHGGPSDTTEALQTPRHNPLTSVVGDLLEDAKTPNASSTCKVEGIDFFSKTSVDELRRVKRSRHSSVADGKKRRVNGSAIGHPSTTDQQVLLTADDSSISSCRSCSSVPASVASTMMFDHHQASSKSSNSIKWKSSMLMRMRTEEGGIDNEEEEEEVD